MVGNAAAISSYRETPGQTRDPLLLAARSIVRLDRDSYRFDDWRTTGKIEWHTDSNLGVGLG